MRMKALSVALSAVTIPAILLSGCGSTSSTSSTNQSSTAKSAAPVTLTAWIMPNSPTPDKDFLKVIEPYLAQHPNVHVKVSVIDWGSAWTKITAAATSGTGPDIMQLGTTWVPAIAAMNGIDKITDKVDQVGGANAYFPASWQTTEIAGQPDVYAVPWFIDARAIFYRKDAFKKAGVDPATAFQTWDSFKKALEKVNHVTIDGKQMAALTMPGKNDWNVDHNIFPWIWAAGGDVLSSDNKHAVFNDAKGLQGAMYYTGLAAEGLVAKKSLEENTSQVESEFANGDAAVLIDGAFMVKNLQTPKANGGMEGPATNNFGVAPLPKGPVSQATFFGGSDISVFSGSQHKAEAWDLIKYLGGSQADLAYSDLTGDLPARKEDVSSSQVTNNPYLAQFSKAAEFGRSYPSIPQWGPIETVLVKHFGNIWDIVAGVKGTYSASSVQQELNSAAKEVDGILSQGQ
jgi:multiple sugar transport system substrate-binding protein